MARLAGKVAFITGAGLGIGRAGAIRFAQEGAHVIVADIDEASGEETVSLARANGGGGADFVRLDVSKQDQVERVLGEVFGRHGQLDIIYNNAGGSSSADGPATEVSIEEFWRVLNVDLFGTFLCCRMGIPLLIASGGGSIVNTTSPVAKLSL